MTGTALPTSLGRNPRLDRWVEFRPDGTVAIGTGKVELGQGITSALAQIAADELDLDYARIRMIPADTATSPNEGVTAGSKSVEESGGALQVACAEVRLIFLERAAASLGASLDELSIDDGTIRTRTSNRTTSYWDLAPTVDLARDATGRAEPKRAGDLAIVGRSLPRLDILGKISGGSFVQDLELPGMLYGRVLRPPSYRARVTGFDATRVKAAPGIRAVAREGRFIGVVAEREEQAIAAVLSLARSVSWSEAADLPDVDDIPAFLQQRPSEPDLLSRKESPPASGERTLAATYSRPFLAHASIGPSCAVARWSDDGRIEIWTHSQSIHPLRRDIGRVLRRDPDGITVHHVEGSGCYGHNGADDAALDAVLLARAVPGRPVKLQWSRDDEFAWEPFGSAMVVRMEGALGRDGRVTRWRHELWSNRHIMRPGLHPSPSLLAAWHLDQGFEPPLPVDALAGGEGASQRNAIPLYVFPDQEVVQHTLGHLPVRTSTLRSIGAHLNVLAIESFMDELAALAGTDPVSFRLRHLDDPRAREVVEVAVKSAGWRPGEARGEGRGLGIGFARYKNEGCYAAVIVEVEVDESVRVLRAFAAVDCGRAVNPDGIASQIEGGVVQALSWTLKEQVRFDRTRITTRSWDDYPIIRFSEAPSVQVTLVNRPEEPSLGAGEGVAGPAAAAVANAVSDAIGIRIRDLPITRERLLEEISRTD